ncbi:hypothetical protein JI435_403210 [Parastagonospora nodorum SN15]|uniref:Uncharacterized protein n=1 Tax=Phaeosphaeria nodorum (strain SN15 / ATCC MYA-4574 / FGSC 10173) TaxID=321614 RepID=A0A7U2ETT9_PHANO|nr:hypothetical protein JI435_403210 [Parastagonospora nodorum SN15]
MYFETEHRFSLSPSLPGTKARYISEAFPCFFRYAVWGRELSRARAPRSLAELQHREL